MTVDEAARFYGVSTGTIRRWLAKRHGRVRGERIDGRWRVWSGNERRARERGERMRENRERTPS